MEGIWLDILFSIILYAIFGYLGIFFSNKIEFLKKFNTLGQTLSERPRGHHGGSFWGLMACVSV